MPADSPIADAFAAVLCDRPDARLLEAPSEGLIYSARDIDALSSHLADALTRLDIAPGHLVVAALGNRAIVPSLVLACLRHGLPLLPVDRSVPPDGVRALAERWGAAVVLVPEEVDLSPWRREPVSPGVAAWCPAVVPAPGAHAPGALLKLTSGSTGEPRATCSEERHLVADVVQIVDAMAIGPRTRQYGVIPLSHSYGFSNLLLPLLWQGTPLVLRPQFVPTQVVPDLRDGALETFAGVPFMFDHLARHQTLPRLDEVRLVISAGAQLPFETVQAFHAATGCKVRSFYGSSETGGICFDDSDALDPRVPVGRPLGAATVVLVSDDDAPAGGGRVQVSGAAVIDRYADERAPTLSGTYLTGDYATRDADGAYVLAGRVASFINVAGRKVHPHEVEAALRALPGVTDAVVLGIDDAVRGQALGACLVSEVPWDARRVREALASRLAPYQLPRLVVVMRALPLTDRGKVDRTAIARLLER